MTIYRKTGGVILKNLLHLLQAVFLRHGPRLEKCSRFNQKTCYSTCYTCYKLATNLLQFLKLTITVSATNLLQFLKLFYTTSLSAVASVATKNIRPAGIS